MTTPTPNAVELLREVLGTFRRCLLPVEMQLTEVEMIDGAVNRDAVLFSFMGSGASDRVTVGEFMDASAAVDTALAQPAPAAGDVNEAAIRQNGAMREEITNIGNAISGLARTMGVDQANADGSWPDIIGRINRLREVALSARQQVAGDGVGEAITRLQELLAPCGEDGDGTIPVEDAYERHVPLGDLRSFLAALTPNTWVIAEGESDRTATLIKTLDVAQIALTGMLRLADMGYEQSLSEPEEDGNFAAYVRAKEAIALINKALGSKDREISG